MNSGYQRKNRFERSYYFIGISLIAATWSYLDAAHSGPKPATSTTVGVINSRPNRIEGDIPGDEVLPPEPAVPPRAQRAFRSYSAETSASKARHNHPAQIDSDFIRTALLRDGNFAPSELSDDLMNGIVRMFSRLSPYQRITLQTDENTHYLFVDDQMLTITHANQGIELGSPTRIPIPGQRVQQAALPPAILPPTQVVTPAEPTLPPKESISFVRQPNSVALIIGIGEYTRAEFPKASDGVQHAEYAVQDAEKMKKYFRSIGIPDDRIIYRTNKDATFGMLADYFKGRIWLRRFSQPINRLYFYFAGHAVTVAETGKSGSSGKPTKSYLLPSDGNPAEPAGFELGEVYQSLRETQIPEIVIILDACYTGTRGERGNFAAPDVLPQLLKKKPQTAPIQQKVILLAAANQSETAGTYPLQKSGLFTYFLLKALTDKNTDIDRDKNFSFEEIINHTQGHVSQEAAGQSRKQTPTLMLLTPADSRRTLGSFFMSSYQ